MSPVRRAGRCVVLGGLLSLACSTSTEVQVPPQTQEGLMDLRSQLVTGKAQIQRTTDAARDLTQRQQALIEPQITRLAREVQGLSEIATQSREQYEARKGQTQQYFKHWEAQLKTMSDSVRESGSQRRAESMASFETLQNKVMSLRETFRPYMGALSESVTYLRTDPTAVGVKAVTARIDEALIVENTLMEKIDAVTAQIDSMRGSK